MINSLIYREVDEDMTKEEIRAIRRGTHTAEKIEKLIEALEDAQAENNRYRQTLEEVRSFIKNYGNGTSFEYE